MCHGLPDAYGWHWGDLVCVQATVAAEQVERMVPGSSLKGQIGNIKDKTFNIEFFKQYNLVLNALDNLEARRHVNRMCLAAGTPFIESGSTGYNGQVMVIQPGITECYDCWPKPAPKTYAVCTIRSTPEKPVHCVVWAKALFELLFGPDDESNVLSDLDRDESDQRGHLRWRKGLASRDYAKQVATRVFVDDIKRQSSMEELWRKRAPPSPIDVVEKAQKEVVPQTISLLEQSKWSCERSAALFLNVISRIIDRRQDSIGSLTFDKDDEDAMTFVTTATNLRATAYGVDILSPFECKGIAGNIIHAIATTNAIVAGLLVLEALKVVIHGAEAVTQECRTTFVRRYATSGRRSLLIQPEPLQSPNPLYAETCSFFFAAKLTSELTSIAPSTVFIGIDAMHARRASFICSSIPKPQSSGI